jgi:hypothetical protein
VEGESKRMEGEKKGNKEGEGRVREEGKGEPRRGAG